MCQGGNIWHVWVYILNFLNMSQQLSELMHLFTLSFTYCWCLDGLPRW